MPRMKNANTANISYQLKAISLFSGFPENNPIMMLPRINLFHKRKSALLKKTPCFHLGDHVLNVRSHTLVGLPPGYKKHSAPQPEDALNFRHKTILVFNLKKHI